MPETFFRNAEPKPPGEVHFPERDFWASTIDMVDYTPEAIMPFVADDYAFSNYLKETYRDVNWRDYVDPVDPLSRDAWWFTSSGGPMETLRSGDGALNKELGLPQPLELDMQYRRHRARRQERWARGTQDKGLLWHLGVGVGASIWGGGLRDPLSAALIAFPTAATTQVSFRGTFASSARFAALRAAARTPGSGAAAPLKAVGKVSLHEAGVNAAIEALAFPHYASQYSKAGLDYTFNDFAADVLIGGVAGGVVGGAVEGFGIGVDRAVSTINIIRERHGGRPLTQATVDGVVSAPPDAAEPTFTTPPRATPETAVDTDPQTARVVADTPEGQRAGTLIPIEAAERRITTTLLDTKAHDPVGLYHGLVVRYEYWRVLLGREKYEALVQRAGQAAGITVEERNIVLQTLRRKDDDDQPMVDLMSLVTSIATKDQSGGNTPSQPTANDSGLGPPLRTLERVMDYATAPLDDPNRLNHLEGVPVSALFYLDRLSDDAFEKLKHSWETKYKQPVRDEINHINARAGQELRPARGNLGPQAEPLSPEAVREQVRAAWDKATIEKTEKQATQPTIDYTSTQTSYDINAYRYRRMFKGKIFLDEEQPLSKSEVINKGGWEPPDDTWWEFRGIVMRMLTGLFQRHGLTTFLVDYKKSNLMGSFFSYQTLPKGDRKMADDPLYLKPREKSPMVMLVHKGNIRKRKNVEETALVARHEAFHALKYLGVISTADLVRINNLQKLLEAELARSRPAMNKKQKLLRKRVAKALHEHRIQEKSYRNRSNVYFWSAGEEGAIQFLDALSKQKLTMDEMLRFLKYDPVGHRMTATRTREVSSLAEQLTAWLVKENAGLKVFSPDRDAVADLERTTEMTEIFSSPPLDETLPVKISELEGMPSDLPYVVRSDNLFSTVYINRALEAEGKPDPGGTNYVKVLEQAVTWMGVRYPIAVQRVVIRINKNPEITKKWQVAAREYLETRQSKGKPTPVFVNSKQINQRYATTPQGENPHGNVSNMMRLFAKEDAPAPDELTSAAIRKELEPDDEVVFALPPTREEVIATTHSMTHLALPSLLTRVRERETNVDFASEPVVTDRFDDSQWVANELVGHTRTSYGLAALGELREETRAEIHTRFLRPDEEFIPDGKDKDAFYELTSFEKQTMAVAKWYLLGLLERGDHYHLDLRRLGAAYTLVASESKTAKELKKEQARAEHDIATLTSLLSRLAEAGAFDDIDNIIPAWRAATTGGVEIAARDAGHAQTTGGSFDSTYQQIASDFMADMPSVVERLLLRVQPKNIIGRFGKDTVEGFEQKMVEEGEIIAYHLFGKNPPQVRTKNFTPEELQIFKNAASEFMAVLERPRKELAELGEYDDVGKEGYPPVRHSATKIRERRDVWTAFMREGVQDGRISLLDERDKGQLNFAELSPGSLTARLNKIYTDVTSVDVRPEVHFAEDMGGSADPTHVLRNKYMLFHDPETLIGYNRFFGRVDTYNMMTDMLRSVARKLALLRHFGTNEQQAVTLVNDMVDARYTALKELHKNDKDAAFEVDEAYDLVRRKDYVAQTFRAVTGVFDSPDSRSISRFEVFGRTAAALAYMGTAAISTVADPANIAAQLKRSGLAKGKWVSTLLDSYGTYWKELTTALGQVTTGTPRGKETAKALLQAGLYDLTQQWQTAGAQSRFDREGFSPERFPAGSTIGQRVLDSMGRAEAWLYGWTGLHRATEISRFSFIRQFNGAFFEHRDKAFKDLPEGVRRFLQHNAMNAEDWNAIRADDSLWRVDSEKGFTIESKRLEEKSPSTYQKWVDALRNNVNQSVAAGGPREALSRIGMPFSRRGTKLKKHRKIFGKQIKVPLIGGRRIPFIFSPVQQGTLMSAFVLNPMFYLGGPVLRLTHNFKDVVNSKSMTEGEKWQYYATLVGVNLLIGAVIEASISTLKGETVPEPYDFRKREWNEQAVYRILARGNTIYPLDFVLHLMQSGPQTATIGSIATDRTPYLNVYNTSVRFLLRTGGAVIPAPFTFGKELFKGAGFERSIDIMSREFVEDFNPYKSDKDIANIFPGRNIWWATLLYRMTTDTLAIESDRRGLAKYRRSIRAREQRGLPIPYKQLERWESWR